MNENKQRKPDKQDMNSECNNQGNDLENDEVSRQEKQVEACNSLGTKTLPLHAYSNRMKSSGVWFCHEYSEVIITFISGFLAGTISRTITAPLDRLKLLMQEGRILQHTMTHPTCHIYNRSIKNNSNYSYSLFQLVKIILKEGAHRKEDASHGVEGEATSLFKRFSACFVRFKMAFLNRVLSLSVFWRGNGINCIKAGPEFALAFGTRQILQQVFFSSHDQSKGHAQKNEGPNHASFSTQFIVSAAAGATAQIIVYPLELIKTRMAVASSAEYTSILDCIRQTHQTGVKNAAKNIRSAHLVSACEEARVSRSVRSKPGRKATGVPMRNDIFKGLSWRQCAEIRALGIAEFYRGIGANLAGIVPNRGVEMGLFFWLQDMWRQYTFDLSTKTDHKPEPVPVKMSLLIGATSSTTAQIVTYPLNLIRLRMQVQGMSGRPIQYKNMLHCFCSILRKEGYTGLYRGLLPNLLKGVPSSTIMYVVFMSTKNFLKQNSE